jgi:anion-transporting  ArsA/GET3 family ATPase
LDPGAFCTQTRLLIVAGKGGVGKTTITAAVARLAARAGLNALIIDVEGKSSLGSIFSYYAPLTYREVVLARGGPGEGEIRARTLTPDDALLEYFDDHGMARISRRMANSGALDVVATAVPGIKDILVMGKVKQLERASAAGTEDAADLLVLDAPAAGHAFTFLAAAQALVDSVSVGPIRNQATDVLEMLSDPRRCQVLLVTLPEETPVNEVVETAFNLEDRVGVHLAPIVVNGLYPVVDLCTDTASVEAAAAAAGVPLTAGEVESVRRAAAFRMHRQELQAEQTGRLADALPLAQLHLPFLFTTELSEVDIDVLADALAAALAPLPDPPPPPAPPTDAAADRSSDDEADAAVVPGGSVGSG